MAFVLINNAIKTSYAQGIFDSPSSTHRPVKLPEIDFDRDNIYFRDLLILQKQIAMIEKLSERETKINEIITAYNEMGLDMEYPPPNRDWCEQIPANLICAYHYPNMYENYDTKEIFDPSPKPIKDQKKRKEKVAPPPRNPLEGLSSIPMDVAQQSQEEKNLLKEMVFVWVKINCLADDCRAVISPIHTDINEQGQKSEKLLKNLRYTIRKGDTLPDGRRVARISADGVTISDIYGQGLSQLNPAPQ